ncbi:MAG: acyl-CoA synthetase [Bdellovibrionaceae bacterium]|nr:acyl-CoA synthetase [Pseudobdellovibrionaceae bacterium]
METMILDKYELNLEKNSANYLALSPISFIRKAAAVYPNRIATIYEEIRFTWKSVYTRSCRLASALQKVGIKKGDTVAAVLPNIPAMVELHFGPAMIGAVLNTINIRLDAEAIAFMLDHGEAKVLFVDQEFVPLIRKALSLCKAKPIIIDVEDRHISANEFLGELEYEDFLLSGEVDFTPSLPADEWEAISLNYTSGTTGNPKGVVYHHRGAAINAVNNILEWGMPRHPIYLWTLPMFHCNGWCFPWTVASAVGTNVCLRKVDVVKVFELMRKHKVTHYCGAPIVHASLINAPEELKQGVRGVSALVAGAAPPLTVIEGMDRMGFDLTHVYGLTETYGPAAGAAKHPQWMALSLEERAMKNGRQGVPYLLQEEMTVLDPETMKPVPWDGETMGEIMFRGNITMKGYLKNKQATDEAFKGGWFHSGDLAVVERDGYVKIKDRSKDIIISGGENISSLEVEDVLHRHPAVMIAAVVAKPDEKW